MDPPTTSEPVPASSTTTPPWTCSVCTSELLCRPHHIDNNSLVCAPCIRRLFELALVDETAWPPKWGRLVLNHWDFRHVLDPPTLRRLDERGRERDCPARERVHCRQQQDPPNGECGAFLGRRSVDEAICRWCERCGLYSCLRCLRRFAYIPETPSEERRIRHDCQTSPEDSEVARQEELDAAFEGLDRGSDYQDCSNCRQRVQLADGCNHITCVCGMEFCYLCGRPARESGNHWDRGRGGCPRYGQPGDERDIYAEEAAFFAGHDVGDEDSSDGENEDFQRWAVPRVLDVQERRAFQRRPQQEEMHEHARNYAREAAEHVDQRFEAALAAYDNEEDLRNDHLGPVPMIPLRRGAVEHGQPAPPQRNCVREDDWPDDIPPQDHWRDRRRAHQGQPRGVRPFNRHDRGWRRIEHERARQRQAEMDTNRRVRASNTAPASRSNLRGGRGRERQRHHTRSWMACERERESNTSSTEASSPGVESSRHAERRDAGGLRDSRRRRNALRTRRRTRDVIVEQDDSGYDGMSQSSENERQASGPGYRTRHTHADARGRATSTSSDVVERRRQLSRRSGSRLVTQRQVPGIPPVLYRAGSHNSDVDSDIREYEQDDFVRQYGRGIRIGHRPEGRPQPSIGRRIWRFCQGVGEAVLQDMGEAVLKDVGLLRR